MGPEQEEQGARRGAPFRGRPQRSGGDPSGAPAAGGSGEAGPRSPLAGEGDAGRAGR